MKIGDELLLCDGMGAEYTVKIAQVDRSEIVTEIIGQRKREIRSPRITLGQGLPKSDKMDLIVQKASELGAASIVPLITGRTIIKIKDEGKRVQRWRKIAREAAMQSQRPDIPAVEGITAFSEFIRTLVPGPRTLLLLPWEEGTEPVKNVLRQNPDPKEIIVLIGPEGGFSQAEADLAKSKGFHRVSLGQNILRTETAALTVLGMLMYEYLL
jgi:16S rRNA (uracil1498-N3)-methyltransferase